MFLRRLAGRRRKFLLLYLCELKYSGPRLTKGIYFALIPRLTFYFKFALTVSVRTIFVEICKLF